MTICLFDAQKTEYIRGFFNGDPEFRLAARFFSKDVLFEAGDSRCVVKVRDGVVTDILLNPTLNDSSSFCIRASVDTWEKFLQPRPPPFFTDLYAGLRRKNFEISGDLEAAFAHFWALARMLDLLRQLQNETKKGG